MQIFRRLRLSLAAFLNRRARKKAPTRADECAALIMNVCALQLERGETRELAPTKGAYGPIKISGGAITTVAYRVFDRNADAIDSRIRQEPWRAFAEVTMRVSLNQDPEFTVTLPQDPAGAEVVPTKIHFEPGYALLRHLSGYFPLLPRPYEGTVIIPGLHS